MRPMMRVYLPGQISCVVEDLIAALPRTPMSGHPRQ